MTCSDIALAFCAGTFPVVIAVPAAIFYFEAPSRAVLWRLFSASGLIILWSTVSFSAIDLWKLDTASGYTLFGIIIALGILLTALIMFIVKAITEHMQYVRYQTARARISKPLVKKSKI